MIPTYTFILHCCCDSIIGKLVLFEIFDYETLEIHFARFCLFRNLLLNEFITDLHSLFISTKFAIFFLFAILIDTEILPITTF
jgi:hypothetical protein